MNEKRQHSTTHKTRNDYIIQIHAFKQLSHHIVHTWKSTQHQVETSLRLDQRTHTDKHRHTEKHSGTQRHTHSAAIYKAYTLGLDRNKQSEKISKQT